MRAINDHNYYNDECNDLFTRVKICQ